MLYTSLKVLKKLVYYTKRFDHTTVVFFSGKWYNNSDTAIVYLLSPHPLNGDDHHRNPSCPFLFQECEGVRCADEDLCVTKCYIVQYPVLLADCCRGFTRCASEHWPCLFTYKLVSGRVREGGSEGRGRE